MLNVKYEVFQEVYTVFSMSDLMFLIVLFKFCLI